MPDRPHFDLLQRQARALGDPTRHEIFRQIEEADQAPGVRELAKSLSLHQSAVRQHLAKLLAAELVIEVPLPPAGPGRPRSVYQRSAGVVGVWTTDNPFERLAALLVDVIRSGLGPRDAGRQAGHKVALAQGTGETARPAIDVMMGLMAAQGFAPALDVGEGEPTLVLGRCPYASLSTVSPEVVCELHLGLAEGLAAGLPNDEPLEVHSLTRADPHTGGCRLALQPARITTVKDRQTP